MATHNTVVLSATLEVLEHVQSFILCWPGFDPVLRPWVNLFFKQGCHGPHLRLFVDELGNMLPPARAKLAHMPPSLERDRLKAAVDALTAYAWDNRPLTGYQQIRRRSGVRG